MPETIDELKKKLAYYERDPEKRAYFALVRIVNMQVDCLNEFNVKSNIGGKKSEDATFERTQGIWEKLPSMIASLTDLKSILKIKKQDEVEELQNQRITPESIADGVGELAGKNNV